MKHWFWSIHAELKDHWEIYRIMKAGEFLAIITSHSLC